ncbi:GLUT4 regulating protein TUG-domain-containing protein [Kalaharituber pfeilii]|nr:GLUT4 regulating protein TUG-domain-containing protein [Kalaharituber pfeilii]
MSAHVVVIDKTARRHTVKVGPETMLNEVLMQACKKAGVDHSNHGLKHNNKILDLSLPFRFTKLSAAAKLELVQLPKSRTSTPAEVTVALQMMDNNGPRLTEKFPSATPVWSILRTFEAKSQSLGVAGINITEVAVASTDEGSGRLYYAMPVVQIVNRELATFDDLQTTLQTMGYSGGMVLLRLKMRPTEIPFEEALVKITELPLGVTSLLQTPTIQAASESPASASSSESPLLQPASESPAVPELPQAVTPRLEPSSDGAQDTMEADSTPAETSQPLSSPEASLFSVEPTPQSSAEAGSSSNPRAITVFAPAQGAVPEAAKLRFDESEYELTVNQARQIQANLAASGRPQRLLSDQELAEKEREKRERREKVTEIEIRVRFPDQMIVQSTFKGTDKSEDLYAFVRSTIRHPNEPFYLYLTPPVRKIPCDSSRLALDLQFTPRMLVNFSWDKSASEKALTAPALSDEYLAVAQAIKVSRQQLEMVELGEQDEEDEEKAKKALKRENGNGRGTSSGGLSGKVPKWLKFGKK